MIEIFKGVLIAVAVLIAVPLIVALFLKKEYKRLQHPDFSKTIVENVALTVQRDIQRVLPLEWQTVDVYGIQNVCVDD